MVAKENEEAYNYWMSQKQIYETNLKNNIGHTESINTLLEKINNKLFTISNVSTKLEHPAGNHH